MTKNRLPGIGPKVLIALMVLFNTSGLFPNVKAALVVTELGKLSPSLSVHDEIHGTTKKWKKVQAILGGDAKKVIIKQVCGSLGGNTSIRNEFPLIWKDKGYYRRARDLGQVFTAPQDFKLQALVLRTGNAHLAFLPGAANAEVFIQFFKMTGTPVIDDNGTPPGSEATHGFSTNHRCDDFVSGVEYRSMRVLAGGHLPDLLATGDGKLTYIKWTFTDSDIPHFEKGKRYAFMVGFVNPGKDRNFTLSNRNNANSPNPPTIIDADDSYNGGWGLRREGNGKNPPLRIPGEDPPTEPKLLTQLKAESTFPPGQARYATPPTCDGYPDVDTYRDHEFYMIER